MFRNARRVIARNLLNFSGWDTKRKIIVIESDDWGSVRMPSKEVYHEFLEKGIPVNKNPYCRYDSLATAEDLEALFNTLSRFTDHKNNHPVITANAVMGNPDFDKIKATGFTQYYFERFTKTLERYSGCSNSFAMWKEGMHSGLFYPQFHGREHLNVPLWLHLLRKEHPMLKLAFKYNFWGLSNNILSDLNESIQAAFDYTTPEALSFQKRSIIEGLNLFEDIFGYRSRSFIAGNYIWDSVLERILKESGVQFIQGMKYQILPGKEDGSREMVRHRIGEKNQLGQTYLVRNCVFEPSLYGMNFDSVGECLKDISNAFFWNKPAIITAHRLNFIGSLDPGNRNRNLRSLSRMLSDIIEKWPQVEFMTSVQLGNIIDNG